MRPKNRVGCAAAIDAFTIFGLQNFFSFLVFGLLAWWYAWLRLRSLDRTTAFTALRFVHALRPIGATVIAASVAGTALPRDFASAVAYGDLVTSALAVMTLLALSARLDFAVALVWLTNIVGTIALGRIVFGQRPAFPATCQISPSGPFASVPPRRHGGGARSCYLRRGMIGSTTREPASPPR